jgi:hypothetical protein
MPGIQAIHESFLHIEARYQTPSSSLELYTCGLRTKETMSEHTRPTLSIPDSLRGAEIGSFAHTTVAVRLPTIAGRVLAENRFPPDVAAALEVLIAELPDGPIRPIHDPGAPDASDWDGYAAPYLGQSWLQVPWFFAETSFYRRILAITGYFQPGAGHSLDPYTLQKRLGLETSLGAIEALSVHLSAGRADPAVAHESLGAMIIAALWGNQADLSLWPVDPHDLKPAGGIVHQDQTQLLINDAPLVASHLLGLRDRPARVDIVVDNAGFELVCDLGLVDLLLWTVPAATIHLHGKAHPTFVSDALLDDITQTVSWFEVAAHPDMRALGARLRAALETGHLRLHADWFWTSPLSGWEMPAVLRHELGGSDLIISKGDANYRRWLGDRRWPFDTPLAPILAYAPAPLALLRTLKSEVAAGLAPGLPAALAERDPSWLTNGRWGVVQFAAGAV